MNKKVRCLTCSSLIPGNSKKCVACGSYQDFRRFIDIGNTSISLLIAFLTLTLLVFDRANELYTNYQTEKAAIDVNRNLYSISKNDLVIMYSNHGYSDAVLPQGVICILPLAKQDSYFDKQTLFSSSSLASIQNDEVEREFVYSYVASNDLSELVLPSGQTRLVKYKYHELVPVKTSSETTDAEDYLSYCSVSIDNVNGLAESEVQPYIDVYNRRLVRLRPLDVFLLQKNLRHWVDTEEGIVH
ncbi:TPA: hypothetical protein P0E27_002069 [Vibrio harveyi]|nr:hypothetical protein [Vibrio harveyi]